jgi:hypothetical protein
MKTLLLDNTGWDLLTDAAGNIALASEPYAVAQDVASALRLFLGELWYNVKKGIPYFEDILGHTPPVTVFQEYMVAAALTVPTVVSAECIIEAFENRTVTGQVTFRTTNGQTVTVSLQ